MRTRTPGYRSRKEFAITTPAASNSPQRIAGPLPCVKCLYDLGGLISDQNCPECAVNVARTLDSPAAASAADLKELRGGLLMIVVSKIGGIVWMVAGQAAFGLFIFSGRSIDAAYLGGLFVFVGIASALTVLSARGWHGLYRACSRSGTLETWRASFLPLCAWLFAGSFSAGATLYALSFVLRIQNELLDFGPIGFALAATGAWSLRTVIGIGVAREFATWLDCMRLVTVLGLFRWTGPALLILSVIVALYVETVPSPLLEATGLVVVVAYGLASIFAGIIILVLRQRVGHFAAAAARRESAKQQSTPAIKDTLAG